ncbi:hypothetical protein [Actinacidiphila soli]|jgi:hypothetical protein|uniref:hypothetical protein n=1 Tax=Actinacidiphila soli TaxID=2487275 RepID=UPI000FCBD006|nr:hypothetical protein [Actinacidiphila soli]
MAADWWSIEVLNAPGTPAAGWRDAYAPALVESAVTNRALAWEWHGFSWGVVFELRFATEEHWQAWHARPGTRAALDAVPDPVAGLLVHRGRGGASAAYVPRRPRRSPGAEALELPVQPAMDHAAMT